MGADTLSYILMLEELNRVVPAIGTVVSVHNSLVNGALVMYGTEEQKARYLPRLTSGEALAAFGLTEPHAGSDAGATRTTAERRGDGWVLNGQKMWITSGALADTVVATARTLVDGEDQGVSCFIVTKDAPGFVPGKDEPKMGLKGSVTSQLFFPDGALGALQRLFGLLRPAAPAPSPVVTPPIQSISENKLDAPPLGQATLAPSRARGSDTTA